MGGSPAPAPHPPENSGTSVRGRVLRIATRVTGAVCGDGRERCSSGSALTQREPAKVVREDRETSGQTMRRQPHLSACRADCRTVRISQHRVNSQRTATALRTLRRALEHSADYAGRSPDSAVCGAAHNFSALCLSARPKPPSRGMGGSSAPRATAFRFLNQHHSAISSCSSSCASASKAASSVSALAGSDGSSAASGPILRADRGFPGCVAVWISFRRRIETWV